MQITISESLSTRLRQLAARRQQPVESIVADWLFTALDDELDKLLTGEQAELRALHYLSNDALRAIAAEQMSSVNQAQLAQLMERHSQGDLDQAEQKTLAALVERGTNSCYEKQKQPLSWYGVVLLNRQMLS